MKYLLPHKFWMATLMLAVALIISSAPLLGFLRDEAARHLAAVKDDRIKTQRVLQRLDGDIAETQKLNGQIGAADVEKSLAYVDRLQAADFLEKQAAAARLVHFTYTVSPEQKTTVSTPDAGTQELAVSTIAVKAEAPLDTDVYAFVERIRSVMPGRMRLQAMTLERMQAADATPAADNLRMTADFEWLSNGVAEQMAERK